MSNINFKHDKIRKKKQNNTLKKIDINSVKTSQNFIIYKFVSIKIIYYVS